MSEKLQIIKMGLVAVVLMCLAVTASQTYTSIDSNRLTVVKVQTDRDIAQFKYLEAKAFSDKAMFEEMAKRSSK